MVKGELRVQHDDNCDGNDDDIDVDGTDGNVEGDADLVLAMKIMTFKAMAMALAVGMALVMVKKDTTRGESPCYVWVKQAAGCLQRRACEANTRQAQTQHKMREHSTQL